MPAFSLPSAPPDLTIRLLRPGNAPLPIRRVCGGSRGFGGGLSPVTFSAQGPSTSELLRTLQRMAASKPTS